MERTYHEDNKLLMSKFDDYQKGVVNGVALTISELEDCKIDLVLEPNDNTILDRIKVEVVDAALAIIIERLRDYKNEVITSFIEENPYYIDEQGNIVEED